MKDGLTVRLLLTVVLALQAWFLVSVALAVHSFNLTDGAGDPIRDGAALWALPSPRVLLVGIAGVVVAGGTIGAWLRVRGSSILRTTSTVFLVLSAVVNGVVLSVAVSGGLWMVVWAPAVPLALLCAEWRNGPRTAPTGLRSPHSL